MVSTLISGALDYVGNHFVRNFVKISYQIINRIRSPRRFKRKSALYYSIAPDIWDMTIPYGHVPLCVSTTTKIVVLTHRANVPLCNNSILLSQSRIPQCTGWISHRSIIELQLFSTHFTNANRVDWNSISPNEWELSN